MRNSRNTTANTADTTNTSITPDFGDKREYARLISRSTEEQEKDELGIIVDSAQLKLSSAELQVRTELVQAKRALEALKASRQFDPEAIWSARNRMKTLEAKQKFFVELSEELF